MLQKSAHSAGDLGSFPGLGRSPGGGNGYPLQYSCLENSMDRGAWWATVCGVAELDTLSNYHSHGVKQYHTMHQSNIPKRTEIDR